MVDPFLTRLLIGVLAYFLFDLIIKALIAKPEAQKTFEIILLIAVVLYVFFGSFLPFR
jgi:Na+-driven multidrug efflux pump